MTSAVPVKGPAEAPRQRRPLIDVARGVALVAMALYHGSWDATFLGLASFDLLGDPLWLAARTIILSSFLLLAGVSLVLASRGGLDPLRFLRRLGLLAAAAVAVSLSSYLLFPDSPIFFGVLHHLTVASVLGLAFLRLPGLVTLAAAVAVGLAGDMLSFPAFDQPWLIWVGMTTVPPNSNDYVPLFPWFSGVLAGIALARLWPGVGHGKAPAGGIGRALAWGGRHSLFVYLVHQPILFGLFWLAAQTVGAEPATVREFHASCTASCVQSGGGQEQCQANCRCVQRELTRTGQWEAFLDNRLDGAGRQSVGEAVRSCGGR